MRSDIYAPYYRVESREGSLAIVKTKREAWRKAVRFARLYKQAFIRVTLLGVEVARWVDGKKTITKRQTNLTRKSTVTSVRLGHGASGHGEKNMGVSANEFWMKSTNGKVMVQMLAQRRPGNPAHGIPPKEAAVELVRDICEWLVIMHRKDLTAGFCQAGATLEQAKKAAENQTSALLASAEGIGDLNCAAASEMIIDKVFHRHYSAGQAKYLQAMAWFANELRRKVVDDKIT